MIGRSFMNSLVAVVTGAAGGIGRPVCEKLAAAGYAIAVADIDVRCR